MNSMEEIQGRVDALIGYRGALAGSERELYDMLMCYANEVAMAVDRSGC